MYMIDLEITISWIAITPKSIIGVHSSENLEPPQIKKCEIFTEGWPSWSLCQKTPEILNFSKDSGKIPRDASDSENILKNIPMRFWRIWWDSSDNFLRFQWFQFYVKDSIKWYKIPGVHHPSQ